MPEPDLAELNKRAIEAFNRMSRAFIEFSATMVALHDSIETQDHPHLFQEEENTE